MPGPILVPNASSSSLKLTGARGLATIVAT